MLKSETRTKLKQNSDILLLRQVVHVLFTLIQKAETEFSFLVVFFRVRGGADG
jgi:hypothetical protein